MFTFVFIYLRRLRYLWLAIYIWFYEDVIFKYAFLDRAIGINKLAIAILNIMAPISKVDCPFVPSHLAITLSQVLLKITLVSIA